jgi:mobilome CxxCx(11)CxxC protein
MTPADRDRIIKQQLKDIRDAKVTALQTALIFQSNVARGALRFLTFLGIAVPIAAGVIITSLYADQKPPFELIAAAGLVGGVQILGSVWALVYNWDRKATGAERYAEEADRLRIDLDTFRPDSATGIYDQEQLEALVRRSFQGLHADRIQEISQRKRDRARKTAETRIR